MTHQRRNLGLRPPSSRWTSDRSRAARAIPAMIGLALVLACPSLGFAQTTLSLGQAEQYKLGVFEAAGTLSTGNKSSLSISGNLGLGSGANFSQGGSAAYNHKYTEVSTSSLSSVTALANSLSANGTFSHNTITGAGSLVVYDLSSIKDSLKIHGNSKQTFIINVSNDINLKGSKSISLAGGVTANHVLFNVGGSITTDGSTNLSGTFLDLHGPISFKGSATLNGSIIGGVGITTGPKSSLSVKANIFNADPIVATAPEMPTFIMGGLAFLSLLGKAGFDRVWRRRATSSSTPLQR
jgi:hypothetical protein